MFQYAFAGHTGCNIRWEHFYDSSGCVDLGDTWDDAGALFSSSLEGLIMLHIHATGRSLAGCRVSGPLSICPCAGRRMEDIVVHSYAITMLPLYIGSC